MPLAAFATWAGDVLEINAAWGEPDTSPTPLVRAHASSPVADLAQAAALGERVAVELMAAGAKSRRA